MNRFGRSLINFAVFSKMVIGHKKSVILLIKIFKYTYNGKISLTPAALQLSALNFRPDGTPLRENISHTSRNFG